MYCNHIIDRFESHAGEQYPGRVGQMVLKSSDVKRSTDLMVNGKSHWADVDRALFHSLGVAIRGFRKQFTFFGGLFKDLGYGVRRTLPGEYYHWRVDGGSHDFANRQLVAIWYLNDVDGPGGETEFRHQAVMIKSRIEKLLLFPPFWTHEHRGGTLERGIKYVATTCVVFA